MLMKVYRGFENSSAGSAAASPAPRAIQGGVHGPLVAAIEDFIVSSGLRSGDLLPSEPVLCEELQVSRTALREAMRVLSALDIVRIQHGKGTFVGSGSLSPLISSLAFRGLLNERGGLEGLREILDVRVALDLGNAQALCEAMRDSRNPELHYLVERMSELASAGKTFGQEDREFHLLMQSRLNSHLMTQLVGAFWDVHTLLRPKLGVPQEADSLLVAQAHADMLHAAEAGDVDAYRSAVERHYVPIRETLESRVDEPETNPAEASKISV